MWASCSTSWCGCWGWASSSSRPIATTGRDPHERPREAAPARGLKPAVICGMLPVYAARSPAGAEGYPVTYRTEKDSLGEKKVPAEAYYGIQTQRAVENYPISGYRAHPMLIRAMGMIKKAAALAHPGLK